MAPLAKGFSTIPSMSLGDGPRDLIVTNKTKQNKQFVLMVGCATKPHKESSFFIAMLNSET